MKEVKALKVNVKLERKVTACSLMPNGQQMLVLLDKEKLITDLYITTFGLVPNSSYVPAEFLNANGSVKVDEYLNLEGVQSVWAIGDVTDVEPSQFITCDRQSAYLAKNITLILSKKAPLPYKALTTRTDTSLCCNGFLANFLQAPWVFRSVKRLELATGTI